MGFPFIDRFGPWWYKEFEIDFVGVSRYGVVICEVEWGLGTAELVRSVCSKADLFMEIERWRGLVKSIVVAKDFTGDAIREAERNNVKLLKINEIGEYLAS